MDKVFFELYFKKENNFEPIFFIICNKRLNNFRFVKFHTAARYCLKVGFFSKHLIEYELAVLFVALRDYAV